MTLTIRGKSEGLRRAMSFASSAALHGSVLAWIAMGAGLVSEEKARSLYEEEIKPHENHIVWYSVKNKLPDVKPAAPESAALRPPRALRQFDQQIVSGAQENLKPAQTILAPAPPIPLDKPLPLPNVLAVAAVPKPKPKRLFTLPPEPKPAEVKLPDAPAVTAAVKIPALRLDQPKAPPRTFHAPPELKQAPAVSAALPLAPKIPAEPPRVGALHIPKGFTAPEEKKRAAAAPALPAAPEIANAAPRIDAPRIPKGFTPPQAKKQAAAPAELASLAPPETMSPPDVKPSLVIVGLKPVEAPDIPTPPGSHAAGFSAAPKLRGEGSDTDTKEAAMTAPGLLARGGTKEAQNTLMASLASSTSTQGLIDGMRRVRDDQGRNAAAVMPAVNAPRVSNAPDPRLDGRAVYVVAIQMPNITSFSGSWLVWFAEREGAEHHISMTAPVPTRKSDPGYVASAREERVEGKVRLFAIIRKTGKVDSVELLQHLDARLDQSAEAALLKWEFEPAKADGVPVDVEAVFEIPFHLAPRTTR